MQLAEGLMRDSAAGRGESTGLDDEDPDMDGWSDMDDDDDDDDDSDGTCTSGGAVRCGRRGAVRCDSNAFRGISSFPPTTCGLVQTETRARARMYRELTPARSLLGLERVSST